MRQYSQRPPARSRTARRTASETGTSRLSLPCPGPLPPIFEPLAGSFRQRSLERYQLRALGSAQTLACFHRRVERLQPCELVGRQSAQYKGATRCSRSPVGWRLLLGFWLPLTEVVEILQQRFTRHQHSTAKTHTLQAPCSDPVLDRLQADTERSCCLACGQIRCGAFCRPSGMW